MIASHPLVRPLQGLLIALTALMALMALMPSWATAQPIQIRDDRGTEHRLSAPPQRIVSMLPSLTETAWVLGVGSRLVGVDRYSNWPAEIAKLPHLGGLDDAQIEAIAALKPDLILASTSSRAMERLEALGFTVVRLKSESHADVRRTLDLVARLLGNPDGGALRPRAAGRRQGAGGDAPSQVAARGGDGWRLDEVPGSQGAVGRTNGPGGPPKSRGGREAGRPAAAPGGGALRAAAPEEEPREGGSR